MCRMNVVSLVMKSLLIVLFVFLVSCGINQSLPQLNITKNNPGVLAIPVSLQSTVATNLLTASDSLEFRLSRLDDSESSQFFRVKFTHTPNFYLHELEEGQYVIDGIRLVDNRSAYTRAPHGDNISWGSAEIKVTIKPGVITVFPEIFHKERFRVGTRHYREKVSVYSFEGERAYVFKEKLKTYKNIEKWTIDWP